MTDEPGVVRPQGTGRSRRAVCRFFRGSFRLAGGAGRHRRPGPQVPDPHHHARRADGDRADRLGYRRAGRRPGRLHRRPRLVRHEVALARVPRGLPVGLVLRHQAQLLARPEAVGEARVVLPPQAVGRCLDFVGEGVHRGVRVAPGDWPSLPPTTPSIGLTGRLPHRFPRRLPGHRRRRVAGIELGVDRGGLGLVLAHRVDELRGQERHADEVAENPQDAAAKHLVGGERRAERAVQALVVMQRDEVLVGDDRDAEERVADDLSGGDPHRDRAVVLPRHRVHPQERPEVQVPGREEREVAQFADRLAVKGPRVPGGEVHDERDGDERERGDRRERERDG